MQTGDAVDEKDEQMDMKRSVVHHMAPVLLLAGLVGLAGCGWFDRPVGNGPQTPESPRDPDIYSADGVPIVNLYVYRVELPVGSTAGSSTLWALVDQPDMSPHQLDMLESNGIRFGIGQQDDWDSLQDVVANLSGAQLEPLGLAALRTSAVPICLQEVGESRTIFLVHPDDTVSGEDYPPAEYCLTFLFTPGPDAASQTVTGVPQIQTLARRPVIETVNGQADFVSRPTVSTLNPLTFQFTLGKRGFMLIAPGDDIDRPTSLGRSLFIRDRDGVPVETLLLVFAEITTIDREN